MGSNSKIEWTEATWTPIRARRRDTGKVGVHCERVSPACTHCYAARLNQRNLPNHGTGLDFIVPNREKVEVFVDEDMLLQPLRWKRPRKIFVCSQTDLFGEFVTDEMIDQVVAVMALSPKHAFQVLTKRPERMLKWFQSRPPRKEEYGNQRTLPGYLCRTLLPGLYGTSYQSLNWVDGQWPLPNVWLGVTAENQEWADKRIPLLLQTPAAKRFVSVEPMLGPVELRQIRYDDNYRGSVLHGFPVPGGGAKLDWVICGGESGVGARPMHPDWARSLRDQCQEAGVPFFFKQWGEYGLTQMGDIRTEESRKWHSFVNIDGSSGSVATLSDGETASNWCGDLKDGFCLVDRVGKHAAGRLLDGVDWSQFPEVSNAK